MELLPLDFDLFYYYLKRFVWKEGEDMECQRKKKKDDRCCFFGFGVWVHRGGNEVRGQSSSLPLSDCRELKPIFWLAHEILTEPACMFGERGPTDPI
eukprot:scaffold7149_cov196-Amphora_coffeaeformis.AAC.4